MSKSPRDLLHPWHQIYFNACNILTLWHFICRLKMKLYFQTLYMNAWNIQKSHYRNVLSDVLILFFHCTDERNYAAIGFDINQKKKKLYQYFIHLLTSSHETDCQAHLHNNVNSLIIKIFILRFFLWFSSLLVFRKYITYNLSYIYTNKHISSKNCIFCKLYILTFITNRPSCDCVCKFVSDTFTFFMINILFKIIAYVPIDVNIRCCLPVLY